MLPCGLSGAVALVVSAVISALASGDSSSYWQVVGTLGLAVLDAAFQPAHVSVWLPPGS